MSEVKDPKFKFGDVVKDTVTGFTAEVVARAEYSSGRISYGLSAKCAENKQTGVEWVDEFYLEIKTIPERKTFNPPPASEVN